MNYLEDNQSWGDFKEYVNVEEGLSRVVGNKKIYLVILAKFLDNTSFAEMTAQIKSGDVENATKSAHAVKGLTLNLALPALSQKAVQIEKELKEGLDVTGTLSEMTEIYQKTEEMVKKLIEES